MVETKIEQTIDQLVLEGISPMMVKLDFVLKNNRLFFKNIDDCRQELAISFRYLRGTNSGYITFFPNFTYKKIEVVASKLKKEQPRKGWPTAAANIGNLRPQHEFIEWPLTMTTNVFELGKLISNYIKDYAVPFWNDFSSMGDLIKGYESQDPRLRLNGKSYKWKMVAIYCIQGKIDSAKNLLEKWALEEPNNNVIKNAIDMIYQDANQFIN